MDRLTADVASAPLAAQGSAARLKARIIIPVWGTKYIAKLDAACLPALLAPGNLPHLAKHFDCELVVVTQAESFEMVRTLPGVQAAARYAPLKLVAMDDVLSHPSYYGYTITHSLFRGFSDLGEGAKDVWCLFLNADFILADGSYRALVKRMLAGERCILSPSYCTVEESVRPALEARIARSGGILDLPPREMAGLILDNRHFTIRAKTVNWKMYKIDHVDQFYYAVDDDTLLVKQIPIAVVAMRPQRIPAAPVAFWDYGIISELCPTADLCVLGDSDEFVMMELRARGGMGDWLKLGWLDKREIARHLSQWSTRDQRRCGKYTMVLHRADLPPALQDGTKALETYYGDVEKLLAPEPRDHRDHYIWKQIVVAHNAIVAQRDGRAPEPAAASAAPEASFLGQSAEVLRGLARAAMSLSGSLAYRSLYDGFIMVYRKLYGRLPKAGIFHPQRADLLPVQESLTQMAIKNPHVLSLCSFTGGAVVSHLDHWFRDVTALTPEEFLSQAAAVPEHEFDACIVELTRDELLRFSAFHEQLRSKLKHGGRILVFYQTKGLEQVVPRDVGVIYGGLPGKDMPVLEFRGGWLAYFSQGLWEHTRGGIEGGSLWSLLRFALIALLICPVAFLGSWRSASRSPGRFVYPCTSLFLKIQVV